MFLMELYSNEVNEIGTYWLDLMMDKQVAAINEAERLADEFLDITFDHLVASENHFVWR